MLGTAAKALAESLGCPAHISQAAGRSSFVLLDVFGSGAGLPGSIQALLWVPKPLKTGYSHSRHHGFWSDSSQLGSLQVSTLLSDVMAGHGWLVSSRVFVFDVEELHKTQLVVLFAHCTACLLLQAT